MNRSKYDAHWWFGENSVYSKSGLKEMLTGAKPDKQWAVPVEHGLDQQSKMIAFGVIGLILLKQFKII